MPPWFGRAGERNMGGEGRLGKGWRRPPVIGPTNGLRLLSSNLSPWNNYVALSRLALSGAWAGGV